MPGAGSCRTSPRNYQCWSDSSSLRRSGLPERPSRTPPSVMQASRPLAISPLTQWACTTFSQCWYDEGSTTRGHFGLWRDFLAHSALLAGAQGARKDAECVLDVGYRCKIKRTLLVRSSARSQRGCFFSLLLSHASLSRFRIVRSTARRSTCRRSPADSDEIAHDTISSGYQRKTSRRRELLRSGSRILLAPALHRQNLHVWLTAMRQLSVTGTSIQAKTSRRRPPL